MANVIYVEKNLPIKEQTGNCALDACWMLTIGIIKIMKTMEDLINSLFAENILDTAEQVADEKALKDAS